MQPHGLYSPWNSLGQNTGVGSLSLLQGIFPTQESNPGLLPCRQILYRLSYNGRLDLKKKRDFPGGPVVKSLPSNEGDEGSIPGEGGTKIPHTSRDLSLSTTNS